MIAWLCVIKKIGKEWFGYPTHFLIKMTEQHGIAENLLRYALGRQTHAEDQSLVRSIVHAAAENDYRFSSFAAGLVTRAAFRRMEVEIMPAAQN